jgi:hypothetical protein
MPRVAGVDVRVEHAVHGRGLLHDLDLDEEERRVSLRRRQPVRVEPLRDVPVLRRRLLRAVRTLAPYAIISRGRSPLVEVTAWDSASVWTRTFR